MVGSIIGTIGEVISKYIDAIADMFESLVAIFYNAETNALTLFGTLFLIGIGIGIVVWAFNLIMNLVRL